MVLDDPTKAAKLERLHKARDRFKPLLEDSRQWENECEAVFSEFRVAVVHLRRDSCELDAVEDKELVWRFLCKLSRDRRPFWGRCEEVLRTLMQSDTWMKAFAADPETNLNDLPTNVVKEFGERLEDVGGRPEPHVRLVLVGCGAVAARFCAQLVRHNERARSDFFRVVALCDAVPARTAALRALPEAAQLRLENATEVPSLEALLDKVEFDAAALAGHAQRERLVSELLARGKLALVEPPLSPTLETAVRLARLGPERLLVVEAGWAEAKLEAGEVLGAAGRGSVEEPQAQEALAEGLGCTLVPGLRWIRGVRRLLGPVEAACGTRRTDKEDKRGAPADSYAACVLRHAGGAVSTLHLRSGPGPAGLLLSGSEGDAEASLCEEERVWDLFAQMLGPIARNGAAATVPAEVSQELRANLQEHLADLTVAQALQKSYESRRFEEVEAPPG